MRHCSISAIWPHEPFIQKHRFQAADSDEADNFLCPRCPAVRQYAYRTVKHLMQTYGCNGLKIDFIDPLQDRASLPCTADHEHDIADYGEAVYDLLQGIYQSRHSSAYRRPARNTA